MPKQTFYNLSEKKRERLMEAIYLEFSRVSYDQVSINKIINNAGIPRGSFYQYFEDKRDVLRYLLEDYQEEILKEIEDSLTRNDGDIFVMFTELMDFVFCQLGGDDENNSWLRILSDMRINIEVFTMNEKCSDDYTRGILIEKMISNINKEKLDIRDAEDLESMLCVLIPYVAFSFAQTFRDRQENYVRNRARFERQLELIKRGFGKKEEKTCLEQ